MKISIFNPVRGSTYGVANHFALKLYEALKNLGIDATLFEPTGLDEATLKKMEEGNPDFIITFFVRHTREEKTNLLFEKIKTPILYYSIDAPEYFIDLIKDQDYYVSVRDIHSLQTVRKMGLKKTLLLPHAADNDFSTPISGERPYDIVFFGTAIPRNIGESMLIDFPLPIQEAVLRAVDLNLSNPFASHYDSLIESLRMDPKINREMLESVDLSRLMQLVEMRVRAQDKIELLKAFKEHKVHIFGAGIFDASWSELVKGNFEFHPEVSFEEVLKIMSQSKIVLNSSPTIRFGGHERIFYAYQMGALPFTTFSPYISEEFKPGENILVYYPPHYNDLDKMAEAVLKDETKRKRMVESGRAIVREKHTWDVRAKELLQQLKSYTSR